MHRAETETNLGFFQKIAPINFGIQAIAVEEYSNIFRIFFFSVHPALDS